MTGYGLSVRLLNAYVTNSFEYYIRNAHIVLSIYFFVCNLEPQRLHNPEVLLYTVSNVVTRQVVVKMRVECRILAPDSIKLSR